MRYLVPWLLLITALSAGPAPQGSQKPGPDLLGNIPREPPPFEEGERLRYEVNWKPLFMVPAFKAGELSFSVTQSEYLERPTYTITARARSEGLLSTVAGLEIRDYFESTMDRVSFRSYRMFRQVRQNKRKRDLEVLFDYECNCTRIRETNREVEPAKQLRDERIDDIPGPIADFLSVFYVARLRSLKPGQSYITHLSGGGKPRRVHLQVEKGEEVLTELGSFGAVKISTVGGLLRGGGNFRVWYSTDALRVPVKFEADAKVGTVYGKIIGLETPRQIRSVIRVP